MVCKALLNIKLSYKMSSFLSFCDNVIDHYVNKIDIF